MKITKKPTTADPEPLLVSVQRACDLLGVGRNTVYDLLNTNELEKVCLFGRTTVTVDSIKRLVARGGVRKSALRNPKPRRVGR